MAIDWLCDEAGAVLISAGGDIAAAGESRALLQAFLHEAQQPISTMPWDTAGESIESEAEGSYLPLMIEQDLSANTARQVLGELKRLAKKSRYKSYINDVALESFVINGAACSIGVLLIINGEALSGSITIGG